MLSEVPFVSADEIAEQFRPGGTATTKSSLETLRRRRLLSEGISRPLRDADGRIRGTLRIYSSLVREAAAFAAAGHDDLALPLVMIAERLERRQDATTLADALAKAAASIAPTRRTIAGLIQSATSEPSIATQLATYADATARAFGENPRAWQVALGHVVSVQDAFAEIVLLDGTRVSLLEVKLPARADEGIGAPVAIRWVDLGRGVWMTAEPAIDVRLVDASIYPFERRGGEPTTIPTAVLRRAPTMRRSGRTTVAD